MLIPIYIPRRTIKIHVRTCIPYVVVTLKYLDVFRFFTIFHFCILKKRILFKFQTLQEANFFRLKKTLYHRKHVTNKAFIRKWFTNVWYKLVLMSTKKTVANNRAYHFTLLSAVWEFNYNGIYEFTSDNFFIFITFFQRSELPTFAKLRVWSKNIFKILINIFKINPSALPSIYENCLLQHWWKWIQIKSAIWNQMTHVFESLRN